MYAKRGRSLVKPSPALFLIRITSLALRRYVMYYSGGGIQPSGIGLGTFWCCSRVPIRSGKRKGSNNNCFNSSISWNPLRYTSLLPKMRLHPGCRLHLALTEPPVTMLK